MIPCHVRPLYSIGAEVKTGTGSLESFTLCMKVEIDQVEKGFILEKFGYFTVFCEFLREYFQRSK